MKNGLKFATLTIALLLPLGCRNGHRLSMEDGPWGLPIVKIRQTSKIPSDVDPFIRNSELQPPQNFSTEAGSEWNMRKDSSIRPAGYETVDPKKDPFTN